MFKKTFAVMSAAALAASVLSAIPVSARGGELDNSGKTAQEVVSDMGMGINLGNTFESCGTWIDASSVSNFEKAWGSPIITKDMIDGYAAEGFKTLRIPVAWSNMMDDDYTIAPEYLERVAEVAQWAVDNDMYVIINEHWDSGWIEEYPEKPEEVMNHYLAIWEQVADYFKDFDDHLIFESQNEELGNWSKVWNRWGSTDEGKQDCYDYALAFNQNFVDLVRNSGGNNDDRLLLISGIITDVDLTCDEMFQMPEDPADKMAVSVHYYTPYNFALSDNASTWGTPEEYLELNTYMRKLYTRFVSQGVPVIIGEACVGFKIMDKEDGEAREYIDAVCEQAYERGMCPVLWDINYSESGQTNNSVYKRSLQQMTDTQLKADLAGIVAAGQKEESELLPDELEMTYGETFDLSTVLGTTDFTVYVNDKNKYITADENGVISAIKAGSTDFIIHRWATDTQTELWQRVYLEVNKGGAPATRPDEEIVVKGPDYKTNQDVPLPEGWSWMETVDLIDGQSVTAKASYEDKSFSDRIVEVKITWYSAADESSAADSKTADDKSSSKADTSSKAASTETKTTNTASATNASTGASTASALALAAVVGAVAVVAKRKNK